MRKIGSISIKFGLINIPLAINSFIQENDISFRQLHKECLSPIQYKKVCSKCGKEVSKEDIVSGFKVGKDEYVVIDKEKLQFDNFETKIVSIIDKNSEPEFISTKFYLLTPVKTAEKQYFLLLKLLDTLEKEMVIEYSMRKKINLAIVKVVKVGNRKLLMLKNIVYANSIRLERTDLANIPQEIEIGKEEFELAKQLFNMIVENVKGNSYKELEDRRLEIIKDMINGKYEKANVSKNVAKFKDLAEQLINSIEMLKGVKDGIDKKT